jgi:hypothetical protein
MKYSKIVSLGLDCQPAHYIRTLSKQTEAYPFDWLITPVDALVNLIEHGPESLFYDSSQFEDLHEKRPSNATIKHKRLGVVFFHDFPPNQGLGAFMQVQSKYRHLATRWQQTLAPTNTNVLFIRHYATKDQAMAIQQAFKKQYPKLSFDLLVVNEGESDKDPWNLTGITNINVAATGGDWHGDVDGWTNIFKQFDLIK